MIYIRIHRKELERMQACYSGMSLFRSLAKRGVFRTKWTQLHMVWFAAQYPQFSYFMIEKGLLPIPNLADANLSGADLSGANLFRADLSGADLRGADLADANLFRADLSGANLSDANLFRADLTRANLAGADLTGADLRGATNCILPPGWVVNPLGIVRRDMIGYARSLKVLESIDFAVTCLDRARDATSREEALEWFRKMRNAIEYVVMVMEEESGEK